MIRLAHDRLLVLDDEHGVAAIAQALHHADELAHVAGMQADARLVEHEEGVDERIAEAGGEIDALDLAAAERAGGAVEREVAESDLEQVVDAREQPLAQLGHRVIAFRHGEELEELVCAGQRQAVDFRKREPVRLAVRAEAEEQRGGLEARAAAGGARLVGAVAREKDAHVHLVGLGFHPLEIALHAVPAAGFPQFVEVLAGLEFALDDERLRPLGQVAKRLANVDALVGAMAQQVTLALERLAGLPRLDHAALDAEAAIRQSALVVDFDRAAEAAAGGAGADRIVEGEKRGRWRAELGAVVGAGPVVGETELVLRLGRVVEDLHLAVAVAQRRLDRLGEARAVGGRDGDAVLHHAEEGGREFLRRDDLVGAAKAAVNEDAEEALLLHGGERGGEAGTAGHGEREADEDLVTGARFQHLLHDLRGAHRPHRAAARRTGERAESREEHLQVIGAFGHGADGAARGLDRVALLDGDGGRQAVDAVDVGLVDALEKLARVRGKGLDVAPLAFRVDRVESERRLARAAQARDNGERVVRDLDVDVLEIVLARTADRNVGTHGGERTLPRRADAQLNARRGDGNRGEGFSSIPPAWP